MFNSTGPHYCPNCPPILNKKGNRRLDPPLECVRSNYSGCGVDIAHCPRCEANFQISYKVDSIDQIDEKGNFVKKKRTREKEPEECIFAHPGDL